MKRILLVCALMLCVPAFAQSPVITQPYGVTSTNGSGTIASTNTFQSVFAASTNTRGRAGCVVQNNSSHTQWVFFGPIASALTTTALQLASGVSTNCNLGGTVLKDQVSITGTAGDSFFAIQQ